MTNVEAATGAQDPEQLADARQNASLTIRTLDRIVSLQDYEDFARAFAGVAKSQAIWLRSGNQRGVFVTVAGQDASQIPEDSDTYKHLVAALHSYGNPFVPVRLAPYRSVLFHTALNLNIDPAYQPGLVQPSVIAALRAAFAFDARGFGQSVALSEVYAVVQTVPGVLATEVTQLFRSDALRGAQPETLLVAAVPSAGSLEDASPAELLTLDPGPITLGVLT